MCNCSDLKRLFIENDKEAVNLIFNFKNKMFYYNDKEIKLTKKEILFLELLEKNHFRIVTYSEIESYVWEGMYMSPSAIRSLVRNIRKKIPVNIIKNLSGIGYKLTDEFFDSLVCEKAS